MCKGFYLPHGMCNDFYMPHGMCNRERVKLGMTGIWTLAPKFQAQHLTNWAICRCIRNGFSSLEVSMGIYCTYCIYCILWRQSETSNDLSILNSIASVLKLGGCTRTPLQGRKEDRKDQQIFPSHSLELFTAGEAIKPIQGPSDWDWRAKEVYEASLLGALFREVDF